MRDSKTKICAQIKPVRYSDPINMHLKTVRKAVDASGLEGMIMFANNKTGDWLCSKPEEERQRLLKTARSKAPEFKKLFQQRRQAMLEERARIQRAKKQAIAHKRAQERKQN